MKNRLLGISLITFMGMNVHTVSAKDIFTAEIQVEGVTQTLGYSSIGKTADQYEFQNLKHVFPNYTENSAVNAAIDLRSVPVHLVFDQNSPTLVFKIPSLGIERTYAGATRAESKDMLRDALKGEDKDLLKKLTTEWVKNSPVDPVAGNPSSLLSSLAGSMTDNLSDVATNQVFGLKNQSSSSFSMMPRFGRYTQQGYGLNVYNLPLSYSNWSDSKKMGVMIDAPITLVDVENGSLSGSANLGIGVNFLVASTPSVNWYLMPQARVGVTGSKDLGTAALIYGGGLVSNAQFPLNADTVVSVINMLSFYKTDSVKLDGYDSGYDLENTILRNGVEYSQVLHKTMGGSPLIAKVSYARTDFSGDQLYSELSHDFAASIGFKNLKPKAWIDEYRVGVTYTLADHNLKGFMFNAGYTF